VRRRTLTAPIVALVMAAVPVGAQEGRTVIPLDPTAWEAAPADGVALTLSEGADEALRLEYDFQGRGGWAAARHAVRLELPESYEIRFLLRGESDGSPVNHLEIKWVDASGENVWWHVKRDLPWPAEWTPIRVRSRQVDFAWGPLGAEGEAGPPRDLAAIELTVTAGGGGSGWIEVAGLEVVPTEPLRPPEGPTTVTSTGSLPRRPPAAVLDGDPVTAWQPADVPAELSIDLRGTIELGGLSLLWAPGLAPERFRVEVFDEGEDEGATIVREVETRGAPESHLRLPDAVAAGLRIAFEPGDCPRGCGLAELTIRSLDFGASANGFLTALAAEAPRGAWPRGFSGEAVYWTVVGVPGAPQEALLSEDGAVEVGEKGFTLEPFVRLGVEGGSKLFTWADAETEPSLAEGDLPIPTVAWRLEEAGARLEITALADGHPDGPGEASNLRLRYRLENRGAGDLAGTLYLAVRPLQVNPPHQFLNVSGGHAPVSRIECRPDGVVVTGAVAPEGRAVTAAPVPDACGAQPFSRGRIVEPLVAGRVPAESAASDPDDLASGALGWSFTLAPGEAMEVVVAVPLAEGADATPGDFAAAENAAREAWRNALGPLELELPDEAAPLVETLRSSLAWILIHQDGPALQPGSRAYARSWIRDGALTGAALLRLGHGEAAKAFAEWFAGYQYPDGKVPCCVDRRGADPVDEHDSHGELIHLVREVYRYTGDRAFAERMLPHVKAAADHLEALRQRRRTAEYESGEARAFYGLLPESISHEGYSAKPVHSYWDDAFGYRGLADAAALAESLGREELAAEWAARRDELRDDFLASIEAVRRRDGLPYLPASADVGDFDPTSTTILLDPGGLLPWLEGLPGDPLTATFERYWRGIQERWPDGPDEHLPATGWDAYTPYEIRHVGAFVRLGWKSEAHELLAHFLADRRPIEWNAWPEVVTRDPRKPQFLGDLPHGWVASDFVRSVLDLFAYEEREAERLLLGAGVPAEWLAGEDGGIAVRHLATPWGELSYRLEGHPDEAGGGVRYRIDILSGPGSDPGVLPPGGIALEYPLPAPDGVPATAMVDHFPTDLEENGRVVVRTLPALVDWPATPFDPRPDPNRAEIVITPGKGNEDRE
jgi:hypothetical protein